MDFSLICRMTEKNIVFILPVTKMLNKLCKNWINAPDVLDMKDVLDTGVF